MLDSLLRGDACVSCRGPGGPLCERCGLAPAAGGDDAGTAPRLFAPLAYTGAARDLVLGLKLRGKRSFAQPLAGAMVACVHRAGTVADVLAWVPARRRDINHRGYDHARVLAAGVARRTGLPARPLVRRVRDVPDQTTLDRAARQANQRAVFAAQDAAGLCVLLIDDLVTTGATAGACASALRAAGALEVEVLCACRA